VKQPLQNSEYWVSVVVPVRDRADLLKRCLDSLASQDLPAKHYEVVVCDDGSAKDLAGTVAEFRPSTLNVRLAKQGRRGPAAARNLGIRLSTSPVVLFIDSDIVADPALIQRLVVALRENPRWAGAEACLLPSGDKQGPLWEAPGAATGGRFHTAAIAYRREALIAAGGLDETFPLPACEDVELAARILSQGPVGFVPDAKAYHPLRKVDIRMHWRSRLHWKYVAILAKRYGFLAFPERKIGHLPRLCVARAAILGLPLGRMLEALRWIKRGPMDAVLAGLYSLFDILCGLWALPGILLDPVPERLNYLRTDVSSAVQPADTIQSGCCP
jgi:glycosyltransferase involved in cell wall biosynthesis